MRIDLMLCNSAKYNFQWFERRWLDAWKFTAHKLSTFKKGYIQFYVAPNRLAFQTKFDMSEQELLEVVSFATFYFNKFLEKDTPCVLTGLRMLSSETVPFLEAQYIYTHGDYKDALTKYYSNNDSNQLAMPLFTEALEIKPEFKFGSYYENGEWKTRVDVTTDNISELCNHSSAYPSMDQIHQTELVQRSRN